MTARERIDAVTAGWTAIVVAAESSDAKVTLTALTIGGGFMAEVRGSLVKAVQEAEQATKERCNEAACRAIRGAAGEHDAPGVFVRAASEAIDALE